MQQSLDRRQPSARSRPRVREIPLQRRYGTAGNGENNRKRGGGVLVGNAPATTTGPGIQPEIAATTGPKVLDACGPHAVDRRPTSANVPGNVELSAAPAAQLVEAVREPREASDFPWKGREGRPVDARWPEVLGGDVRQVVGRDVSRVGSLEGLAALSAGTARAGAERVNRPTVDVASDQLDDPQPADGHLGEEGQLAAVAPAAGDLPNGDLTVISDQAWEWMEPLLPPSTGRVGRRWRDHRQVVEAICWKCRTGSPWRQLPARFGPWQTAYERLTRWSADGTWARLLARAQTDADAAGELDWLTAVASTEVRVHQRGGSVRLASPNAAIASRDDTEAGAAA
jgi:transposase